MQLLRYQIKVFKRKIKNKRKLYAL